LDHHIPCSKESGKPVFSHSNGGELWVLLLEKAYSKIYGAYDKIEQGLYGQALRDLTGAPYEYHIVNDDEPDTQKYWEFIINGNSKNFLLGASSTSNAKGKE
jgi:calpain-15